jgi:hypothetical protein
MSKPKVHKNVREDSDVEDVERQKIEEEAMGKPAAGLIGNGQMVDPRLIAPR